MTSRTALEPEPEPRPPARRLPRFRAAGTAASRFLAARPWLTRAVRTTGAAVIAWVLVRFIPGPWSEYPYYAPLGAVIATSVTVRGTTRRSVQAVVAIALGAVIARVTDAVDLPGVAGIAVVVLAGVLLSGWRLLGDMGSWVPTAALFVLILGNSDPVGYISAYVGLTLFGALVGVGVNLLIPPLPLTPAERSLDRLRTATAEHLDALAAAVRDDDEPVPADGALRTARAAASAAVADAQEAARGNWTARHYRSWRQRQDKHAASLDAAAVVALDVRRAVATARTVADAGATPPEEREVHVPILARAGDQERADAVREGTARAIEAGAALVRALRPDGPGAGTEDAEAADRAAADLAQALDDLQEAVAADRATADGATRPADGVVVALTPLLTG
ncbi:FUSC family protein [Cellulomonas pakistanensis]|uniref:FUSC family protein n=1 Tax=Cellulomonas pakistanensis TaxID=992287 RepID=A0A919PD28_9CELL|nr:hypothetical protein [Cellulomonas pakistanensis]GIG37533.1 hypothetical protein Cpa01nite_29140 [Cellulomonas pakistanensis]